MELHQMFDLGTEKSHAELMKKYLPNYHINLVDVRRLKNLESFQSDLQIIFGMLQCSQDKYALRTYVANHKDYFQKLDLETYHALGAFLNSRQLMEINVEKEEKEELDMCKALEDIYNDGVQAGIEQGRQSGIAEGEAMEKNWVLQRARNWERLPQSTISPSKCKSLGILWMPCSGTDGVSG